MQYRKPTSCVCVYRCCVAFVYLYFIWIAHCTHHHCVLYLSPTIRALGSAKATAHTHIQWARAACRFRDRPVGNAKWNWEMKNCSFRSWCFERDLRECLLCFCVLFCCCLCLLCESISVSVAGGTEANRNRNKLLLFLYLCSLALAHRACVASSFRSFWIRFHQQHHLCTYLWTVVVKPLRISHNGISSKLLS